MSEKPGVKMLDNLKDCGQLDLQSFEEYRRWAIANSSLWLKIEEICQKFHIPEDQKWKFLLYYIHEELLSTRELYLNELNLTSRSVIPQCLKSK